MVAYELLSHPHSEQMDLKTTLNIERGSECAEEEKYVFFSEEHWSILLLRMTVLRNKHL